MLGNRDFLEQGSPRISAESCSIGADRRAQREAAVTSALALQCTFTVQGDILKRVKVFKDLGCLLAQDVYGIQAVGHQIHKARGIWACFDQVLRGENATPRVAAKFYKAVVQSVLLYGSETWNLTQTVVACISFQFIFLLISVGSASSKKMILIWKQCNCF